MTVTAPDVGWSDVIASPRQRPGRLARFVRGERTDARWIRPSLLGLLLGTAVLYLYGLGHSGYANEYYSAAVQAGASSWKAFFFGSFDASNFITVDKTPASLWVMELSARAFGVNSWSILVPQALEGVAAVALLYAAVRRWAGPVAGLIAGLVLAVTPVATLMFRFNNPDALLVLLLVAAAYAATRAVETGRTYWLLLAGSAVGFGFLAKMLQALLVVPAFGLAYLVAGPPRLGRRIGQLLLALAALVVSAGWWVAIVQLVPASSRPYIGGSPSNSVLELMLGYNGLGRLNGNETGSVGFGNGTGPAFGGAPRWNRLLGAEFGGQAGWLLPAALAAIVVGFWLTWRGRRTDLGRAGYIIWGGWLLVTAGTFSFMRGIIHSYYLVALAPAIGALVGAAAVGLWARRDMVARVILAALIAGTAVWASVMLDRSADWYPWLRTLVLFTGVVAALGVIGARWLGRSAVAATGVAGLGLVAVLAAPLAYSLQTAATAHTGALPSAGPAVSGGFGGPGGGPGRGVAGGPTGGGFPGGRNGGGFPGFGTPGNGGFPGFGNGGQGGLTRRGGFGGGPGGAGGLMGGGQVDSAVTTLLRNGASGYKWSAAALGATAAAPYQLASGTPVLAIGGFNGTDPTPTLAAFQQLVANHQIHYFLSGRGFGGGQGSDEIATWVTQNFTATTVGNTTVYDLSGATTGS
ncbi:MAG: hypothetical protein V7637_5704 [Mycobacteriales bacterium]|jgi:4-amino-4-deoxy-L-arabinose transferase-like glycosyltransferase